MASPQCIGWPCSCADPPPRFPQDWRRSVGNRSIENDFFFTNVLIRSGLSHKIGIVGLQAGIEIRSYDYQLDQVNRVDKTFRDQE